MLTSAITDRLDEIVTNGAAFLDSTNKGWFKQIRTRSFDIKDIDNCVLGQLGKALTPADAEPINFNTFTKWNANAEDFFEDGCLNPRVAAALVMSGTEACERGFNIPDDLYTLFEDAAERSDTTESKVEALTWGYLNAAWIDAVNHRKSINA